MSYYTEEEAKAQLRTYKDKIQSGLAVKYLDLISSFVQAGLAQTSYERIEKILNKGLDEYFSLAFALLHQSPDPDLANSFEQEYEHLVTQLEDFKSELIRRAGNSKDAHAHVTLAPSDERKLDNLTQALVAYIFEVRRLVKEWLSSQKMA